MSHYHSTRVLMIAFLLQIILVLNIASYVKTTPDTTVLGVECSDATYGPNDVYGALMEGVLEDLVEECPDEPYLELDLEASYGDVSAYGYACCNIYKSADDCFDCLLEAEEYLFFRCNYSVAAVVEMVDCCMQYDNHPF